MSKIKITIKDITNNKFCIDVESGEKVYSEIVKYLDNKKKIEISFEDIELITSSFLNTAIGKLYKKYKDKELKKSLEFTGLDDFELSKIKQVQENAILYYKNPERMNRSIKELLDEQ